MNREPKGPVAARLRQRKFKLLRRFSIPKGLLPGSLTLSYTRCGKPTCHCAKGKKHPAWTYTFMAQGQRRVERIPAEWAEAMRRRIEAGREFQDAVREVLGADAELLILARKQRPR